VLVILLVAAAPAFALQEQHGGAENKQEARPEQRQEPARPQPQQRANRTQQPGHAAGQQASWQAHKAGNFKSEHRTWQQRGGYHGYRIPDDRFRASFGEDHRFRMSSYPMSMDGGYPRFQYGGMWMSVLDPWPEYWAANWYSNDDVYIVFIDGGYYLCNRNYPGDQIALSVSF
jgi:hypothetical protein